MQRCVHAAVAAAFAAFTAFTLGASSNGGRVEYIGGTVASLKVNSDGRLEFTSPSELLLHCRGVTHRIPYHRVNVLEYGQQVNRRYVAAVVVSPLLLLAKSRRHFLTIGYQDEQGAQQSLVFRVRKEDVRMVLVSLEARTGRKVEFQDAEARKSGKG